MEVLKLETWVRVFSPEELVPDKVREYLDFIVEARDRYDSEEYSEWHHVMPKCIDLDKRFTDQGVRINGRDHFLAHKILVSCFSGEVKRKLSFALTKMLGHLRGEITPEDFEEARRLSSEALKGNQNALGYRHDDETRRRMSENSKGLVQSDETKLKRRETLKGHEVSQETRDKISQSLSGRKLEGDCLRRTQTIWCGKHHTEDSKRKISEEVSGEKNGMFGKTHSESARKSMSESRKGNQFAKGNIWITDGVSNKVIRNLSDIPQGWRQGRTICKRR